MSTAFPGTVRAAFHSFLRGARPRRWILTSSALVVTSLFTWAFVNNLGLVAELHQPLAMHIDQATLNSLLASGNPDQAFETAFEHGDELFDTRFNALDGVGANVGHGQRFTRVPRADLTGPNEWAMHVPARTTGPNAESCTSCHADPHEDGSGSMATTVHRDPLHTGSVASFIERSTPHTFGAGAVQRLAEEVTTRLHLLRETAVAQCCASGAPVTVQLVAKGVNFGSITVTRTGTAPCTTQIDTAHLRGINADLVVRPFQWKGSVAFLRDFNRGAAHNEIGMQATELVGDGVDGDGDGVVNELTVGDMTSMALYLAAQPRPTTKVELNTWGLLTPPLSSGDLAQIRRGQKAFRQIGCANCHAPSLTIDDPTFSEPSKIANYRDALFPSGQNPIAAGVDPAHSIHFDLTVDQPDNRILDGSGNVVHRLGSFPRDASGAAVVELYGDLRRHDMGPGLAESIDEVGTGASVFLTKNLWGVGSTAPYMHDGRATTLTEAILEHGGEGVSARAAFEALATAQQADVIAFLDNLVLFKLAD